MLKLEFTVFNLKTARMVLRLFLAFCGLMAILLTASCGPSSSGSKTKPIPVPIEDERNEIPDSSSQSETLEKIETEPAFANSESHLRESDVKKDEITPEVKETPETKIIPMGDTAKIESDVTPEPTTVAQEPKTTKSDGDKNKDVQSTVAGLTSNYLWATMPTFVDSYKDPGGQVIEHFKVSSGDSQELKNILAKMRDDLVSHQHSSTRIQLEIKEQGTCENKQCDLSAPICLSLEEVKSEKLNASLEQSLRPLLMREFAKQHCADEALAKQVQQYYELPAIQNFNVANRIFSTFTRLRADLQHLRAALTTGLMPNAGKYSARIDTKEQICNMIVKGSRDAQILKEQAATSEFVKDSKSIGGLIEIIHGMRPFCEAATEDRQDLLQRTKAAIQIYDQLAQEFSKNSGMIVLDFSKHLWPFENADESQN